VFWGKFLTFMVVPVLPVGTGSAQMIANTQAPNTAKAGSNDSLQNEIGAGRGSVTKPYSSLYHQP
jgi:hypothetical protein